MAEILIVDDERVVRKGLKALLAGEGFAVREARDGEEALSAIAEKRPDLVLLDVMMPKMNGFRACEEIRKIDALLPVVFLTAKAAEADQVRGMGLGADDYVSKDASDAVLFARLRRALERAEAYDAQSAVLALGHVRVNLDRASLVDGEKTVVLTSSEIGILRLLVSGRGRVFTKDEIIAALRGAGYACEDGLVYTHVYNLRRKLGSAAEYLVCDRALGYKLMCERPAGATIALRATTNLGRAANRAGAI